MLYAVELPNGLETYAKDRAEAEVIFQHCAAIGQCHLVVIVKCVRRVLASSIRKTYAPTLGHYEQAVFRARRGEPVYDYGAA